METSGVPKVRGVRKAPGGRDTELAGCTRLLPEVLLGLRSEGSPGTWVNVCVVGGRLGTVQGMQMSGLQGSAWWQLTVFCSGILNVLEMLEILLRKEINFSDVFSGFHRQGMPVGYNWRAYCSYAVQLVAQCCCLLGPGSEPLLTDRYCSISPRAPSLGQVLSPARMRRSQGAFALPASDWNCKFMFITGFSSK